MNRRTLSEHSVDIAWRMGLELHPQRFFIPNTSFWENLKKVQEKFNIQGFVDCGTGTGDVPLEANSNGIAMMGCDIAKRTGCEDRGIQIMPAHHMPINEAIWPIVCRPDHGGWVEHLLQRAQELNSGFIYVGLNQNVEKDLPDLNWDDCLVFTSQGNEEEIMIVVPREEK